MPEPGLAHGDPVTVRSLLGHRHVRRLAGAELCSALGSSMAGIAITFLSYTSTGSLVHTVVVAAAYTLPAAVLGVPAGRLADHHSRRRLLALLWSAKALSYAGMAGLSAAGALTPGWLLVTSLVAGSLSAVIFPAWEEYEKDLIPPDLLGHVNALFASATSLAALVGAVCGAAVVVAVGETAVFVLNGLTFVPLVVVVWTTHPREVRTRGRQRPGRLRATLRALRGDRELRRPIRNVAVLSLIAAPLGQLLPAIADALDPGGGAAGLGFVTAAFATGSTFVVLVVDGLRSWFDRPGIVELSFLLCSVVMSSAGAAGLLLGGRQLELAVVAIALLVPVGLAISMCQSATSAILQVNAPTDHQGGLFALYGIAFTTLAPLGALTLGRLAEQLEVWAVITLDGALLSAYAAYLLWDFRQARQRDELPPAPDHRAIRAHLPSWGSAWLFAHASPRVPLTVRWHGGHPPGAAGGPVDGRREADGGTAVAG